MISFLPICTKSLVSFKKIQETFHYIYFMSFEIISDYIISPDNSKERYRFTIYFHTFM
jgi:hypothetical protein